MNLLPIPVGTSAWIFSEAAMERLGWILVHSFWQFLLVAILAQVILRFVKRSSASLRYVILVFAIAACAILPLATWFSLSTGAALKVTEVRQDAVILFPKESMPLPLGASDEVTITGDDQKVMEEAPASIKQPTAEMRQSISESNDWWMKARDSLRPWLMSIVTVWILGVMICAMRPLFSWMALRRFRCVGTTPVSQDVTELMLRLSDRLCVGRTVEILRSNLVDTPLVFGFLRPLILLPASLLTSLPASQLEAIIAHELAHVRRHDFLVNFMQTIIETLFFYHPAIWWLSRRIRIERENCCDDLVVSVLCNRVDYGRALLAVEEHSSRTSTLALGARGGSLLARVQRLAGLEAARRGPVASVVAMITSGLLIAGTACMVGSLLFAAGDDKESRFGEEVNGLQIRLIPLSPDGSDESPELKNVASSFKRSQDMTFAVQLKNVSQKAISVAGIRYGDGYAPETQGKLNTAMLAPHWFEFEFTDMDGKRITRTPHREFYQQSSVADNSSVHILAPGESLIEVLRPAKFMQPMDYDLLPGKYLVQVKYRGPNDALREFVRKHWPDKPILNAWPHQATSNVSDFSIEEPSKRTKPEELIWGKPVEGLQAALEYRLPDDAKGNPLVAPGVSIGTRVGITFHLRNVSDKPITFVSETGRQGDHVHVTDEAGKEVEVKNVFFTGWPIDVAWKLMPGEVAQLGLLTPGLGSLDKSGKYKVRYTIRFNSRQQKDESGKIIFPRPGDYDKEVDTGETPLFLQDPKKDVSVLKSSENPFTAIFPNDIRVEFVGLSRGVGDIKSADKWWRPDGSPLVVAPEHRGVSGVLKEGELESDDPFVRTVIHVHGISDNNAVTATAAMQIAESMEDKTGGHFVSHHGYVDAPGRTRTFEVGVAAEPFSPSRWLDRDGKRIESKTESGKAPPKDLIAEDITIEKVGPESWGKGATNKKSTSKGGLKDPVGPGDKQMGRLSGTTQVTIRFPMAWRKVDLRLFAIDKSGNSHADDITVTLEPNDEVAEYVRLAKVIPVDYSEVDHFEYQFRVYRHWAIFENVSLWKATKTEVVMKSETIPTTSTTSPTNASSDDKAKHSAVAIISTGDTATNRGTLKGRFVFDGALPSPKDYFDSQDVIDWSKPQQFGPDGRISGVEALYRMFLAEGVRPETKAQTLLVDKDSGVANIYIWATSKNIPWDAPADGFTPANVEFRDGKLTNRCLKVVVNQKLQFENHDPVDHSLAADFFKARNNSFNFVVKSKSKYEKELSFPVAENFPTRLGLGRAPWSSGVLFVHNNPYVAITESDGSFEIEKLPVGEWEFQVWHEAAGYLLPNKGVFKQAIVEGENNLGTKHLKPEAFGILEAASAAAVKPENREQIGTVQGKPVYRDEITNGNLLDLFTKPIWTKYKAEHREAIEPTEKELEAARSYFSEEHRVRLEKDGGEAKLREQLKAIEEKLAKSKLSEDEVSRLELEHSGIRARLRPFDPGFANFILDNWKLQKHLYQNFGGGRVLWQQAGQEAFDAMRTWLELQEKKGEFQISDPKVRTQFYQYWNQDHGEFLNDDKERIRKEFLEPPWGVFVPAANAQSKKIHATTNSDIEKTVLDILRTPFVDDPDEGTWQLGAHDIDVHWKLRDLPQRIDVIKTLFKVIDRTVPSSMHERRLAMEFLGGADPRNLVPRLNKEIENALINPAKPLAVYLEIEMLGRMGEHARSSVPLLIKLLDSNDRAAYDAAVNGLIIIGARSPDVMYCEPWTTRLAVGFLEPTST